MAASETGSRRSTKPSRNQDSVLDGRTARFVAAGIVDPAKVVRIALQDAVSIAGLLITTEAAVVEASEPPEAAVGM